MKVCQTMLSVTAPKLALGPVQERERGPPISPFMVPFQVRGWGGYPLSLFTITFVPLGCPIPGTPRFISDHVCPILFIHDCVPGPPSVRLRSCLSHCILCDHVLGTPWFVCDHVCPTRLVWITFQVPLGSFAIAFSHLPRL